MKRALCLLAAAGLALAPTACKSGKVADDPILQLGAEESLVQGKDWLTKKKYNRARPYFTHAFEVEPNPDGGTCFIVTLPATLRSGPSDRGSGAGTEPEAQS